MKWLIGLFINTFTGTIPTALGHGLYTMVLLFVGHLVKHPDWAIAGALTLYISVTAVTLARAYHKGPVSKALLIGEILDVVVPVLVIVLYKTLV